ncbi:hypothetical protein MLD38_001274 [Melastoma candidum]|uniref:Uncharacterized protein n=1 Tax=Melastoma candidum TaxID=119954 RepID=A0ACB9SEB9_9MYRT|nr:hypothetical protein MLD38_001274 [Melastoma candidum]
MGSVCCCLQVADLERLRSSYMYRSCVCLDCFVQNFSNMYSLIFRRGELRAIPSTVEGAASAVTIASHDNSFTDTYRSPPRPLPYDVDLRCVGLQRDGMILRREKGSSHVDEESEPLRSDTDVESDAVCPGHKLDYACEGLGKQLMKSSLKPYSAKDASNIDHIYLTSKEEDVCPTCLEEYTADNPRITTKCSHHFHLGCIYEWMERSESCPVCGQMMVFDETA